MSDNIDYERLVVYIGAIDRAMQQFAGIHSMVIELHPDDYTDVIVYLPQDSFTRAGEPRIQGCELIPKADVPRGEWRAVKRFQHVYNAKRLGEM